MKPIAEMLKNELTEDEMEVVPRSYDVIGSESGAVIVIEIPEELKEKKKLIGEALLKFDKNVKSVLNKTSGRKGTFRLEDTEVIAGDDDTEVLHKEHGYTLKVNPQKVFFSPREATERQRVASQVRPNENVLVMFSGVAPYAICIAKKQPNVGKVYCVEINPDAHRYAQENLRINKLSHKIILINDDVRNLSEKLDMKFDRVVMPIAIGGEKFLDVAFKFAKDNGIIHFYYTGKDEDLFSEGEKIVKEIGKENGKNVEIENEIKMLPFGVRMHKICIDLKAGVG